MNHETASFEDYSKSWLQFQRLSADDVEREDHGWVVDGWIRWPEMRPTDLWRAILLISTQELTLEEAIQLGTGPVESLLNEEYQEFARLMFDEAKSNRTLTIALGHVIPPDEFDDDFEARLTKLQPSVT